MHSILDKFTFYLARWKVLVKKKLLNLFHLRKKLLSKWLLYENSYLLLYEKWKPSSIAYGSSCLSGIGSLVRNGDFRRRQNYQPLMDRLDLKRNVASLARSYNFPSDGLARFGKRSIATLAKNGDLPNPYGKRSIQSLARNGGLGKRSAGTYGSYSYLCN